MPAIVEPDILDFFAGPGGWDRGAELANIDPKRIVGFELDAAAVETARAAGYNRVHGNVLDLSPADFPHIRGLIASAPCPTFSASGKRTGLSDYQHVLDVITHLGADPGCDCTWEEMLGDATGVVRDQRTPLVLQAVRFAFVLPSLEWLILEQVPALEFMWEDIAAELYSAGWEYVDVGMLDAMDFGVPSRRRRAFLVAHKTKPVRVPQSPAGMARTSAAAALGWGAGEQVRTRANRKPGGGNLFLADRPAWCLTEKARTWTRESDGARLTSSQAGVLNGFPANFPWFGSRSRQFLQAANVVAPQVAAALLAEVAV
jgi:DNA (cytosine-5)-methyltransferase 1